MFWAGFGGPIVVSEAVWSDFGSVRTSSGWLFSISVAGTSGGPEGPEAHAGSAMYLHVSPVAKSVSPYNSSLNNKCNCQLRMPRTCMVRGDNRSSWRTP